MGIDMDDVKWWHFWNPWSGAVGGTMMGALGCGAAILLAWLWS